MLKNTFVRGHKKWHIAEAFLAGVSRSQAVANFTILVESQSKPWLYQQNVNGSRMPYPIRRQLELLVDDVNRVYNEMERRIAGGSPMPVPIPEPDATPDEIKPDEIPQEVKSNEVKPVKAGTHKRNEKQWFYDEWFRLRQWIADTASQTNAIPVDSLESMRSLIDANKLIDLGISAELLRYVMCMHWPKATLDMAGVKVCDFRDHSEPIADGFHYLSGYVEKLVAARVNIMIIGPSGTGKSHVLKQVAKHVNLNYGETPINDGATRGDLMGRHTMDGFIPSQNVTIYSKGGIHNFEEIDAADEAMLIVMNNALASDELFNSVDGNTYFKHETYVAASTANTFGLGADSKYTGRSKLDFATLDRFRMGRVLYGLDEILAKSMILG